MNLRQPVSRAWPFRLFAALCVAWAASAQLLIEGSSAMLVLLLVCALAWPLACGWCRRYDTRTMALTLHVIEGAWFGALAAGLDVLSGTILLAMLLAGPAAVGGWRFLLPCLLVVTLSTGVSGLPDLSGEDVAGLVMLFGFTLLLALVSFTQAQRLHGQRTQAEDVSSQLGIVNAHLERYLPQPVRDNVRTSGGCRQPPNSCWVVVVFIDLVGFSVFVRSRSAAEVADVVDGYHGAVDRLANRHGGILGKFLGDGVLVYFPEAAGAFPEAAGAFPEAAGAFPEAAGAFPEAAGILPEAAGAAAPGGRNMDAVRCVTMISALPDLLEALNREWRQRGQLVTLQTRTGIASGYCAIGDWGGDKRLDYTLIGDPVNLASRLQAAAEPGSVLLCEATAALLESSGSHRKKVGPARPVTLKGYGEIRAYPLVDAATAPL